jgi:hypothetical protein
MPTLRSSHIPLFPPPPLSPLSQASLKKIDPEDIEVDIDSIDPTTFWLVDAFVRECLPGGKKMMGGGGAAGPKKGPGGQGGAAGKPAGASGAAGAGTKKARVG